MVHVSDKTTASIAKGIVSKAAPLIGGVLPAAAKATLDAVKKGGGFQQNEPPKGKARNGYGRICGKDRFAVEEGGIIVCMPAARGPVSSHSGSRPHKDAEKRGRLPQYVPERYEDRLLFPCREQGGQMQMEASMDGKAWIIVFDSKYQDNDGVYEVDFTVIR